MAKEKIVLALVLLLGAGLRLVNLDQSFWLDEASQAQMSALSVKQIWFDRGGDFHPPLFYLLAHLWLQFGKSEVWLRLLPVTFGVANIYVLYLLAKKIIPGHQILSSFLLAIAPFHIYYSQEFRSYSLLCLLSTLSMYFLFQKKYMSLIIINSLLFYTHYSSIFLLLTQLFLVAKADYKKYLIHNTLYILLISPWLPQFLHQLNSGVNIDTYLPGWRNVLSLPTLKAFPVTLFKLIAGRINFLSKILYGLYIVFVFGVTFAALFVAKFQKRFLLTWALVPIFIMMAISFAIPQSQPFRVIFVLPAFILLMSQAAHKFPKLFLTLFIYIALTGNITYYTRPRIQREDWRGAAEFLAQKNMPVVIKFSGNFAPLAWYDPHLTVTPAVQHYPASSQEVARNLMLLSTKKSVLLVDYLGDLTDPNRVTDRILDEMGFKQGRIHDFSGVGFIREYHR